MSCTIQQQATVNFYDGLKQNYPTLKIGQGNYIAVMFKTQTPFTYSVYLIIEFTTMQHP